MSDVMRRFLEAPSDEQAQQEAQTAELEHQFLVRQAAIQRMQSRDRAQQAADAAAARQFGPVLERRNAVRGLELELQRTADEAQQAHAVASDARLLERRCEVREAELELSMQREADEAQRREQLLARARDSERVWFKAYKAAFGKKRLEALDQGRQAARLVVTDEDVWREHARLDCGCEVCQGHVG